MTNRNQEKNKILYEQLDDAVLIRRLRQGEAPVMDYLMEKYKYLVRKRANALFLLGGDSDDLIQEGMIGLFKAIRDYDEKAGSFYAFAELCINRQLYTAIEAAARKKHGPLNSYVSLSGNGTEGESLVFQGGFAGNDMNPEQMLIDRENLADFQEQIHSVLSRMEREVLDYYLNGMNYRQIALEMGKPEKSIDNALQRIKGKFQKILGKYKDKRGNI